MDLIPLLLQSCWEALKQRPCVCVVCSLSFTANELPHDKTNKMACAPNEDPDQPGHPPSLSRAFPVHMRKHWALHNLLSAQWRLWSDWVDAQADLSLRWAHNRFVAAHIHLNRSINKGNHIIIILTKIYMYQQELKDPFGKLNWTHHIKIQFHQFDTTIIHMNAHTQKQFVSWIKPRKCIYRKMSEKTIIFSVMFVLKCFNTTKKIEAKPVQLLGMLTYKYFNESKY